MTEDSNNTQIKNEETLNTKREVIRDLKTRINAGGQTAIESIQIIIEQLRQQYSLSPEMQAMLTELYRELYFEQLVDEEWQQHESGESASKGTSTSPSEEEKLALLETADAQFIEISRILDDFCKDAGITFAVTTAEGKKVDMNLQQILASKSAFENVELKSTANEAELMPQLEAFAKKITPKVEGFNTTLQNYNRLCTEEVLTSAKHAAKRLDPARQEQDSKIMASESGKALEVATKKQKEPDAADQTTEPTQGLDAFQRAITKLKAVNAFKSTANRGNQGESVPPTNNLASVLMAISNKMKERIAAKRTQENEPSPSPSPQGVETLAVGLKGTIPPI